VTEKQRKAILTEMRRMVKDGVNLVREELSLDKARAIMSCQGYLDKERLLRWTNRDPVVLYRCEGIYDFLGGALADNAAIVPVFDCTYIREASSYQVLLSPIRQRYRPSKRLQRPSLCSGLCRWLDNLNVSTMDNIHHLVANGLSRDFIMVCEALHTKTLSEISTYISNRPRYACFAWPALQVRQNHIFKAYTGTAPCLVHKLSHARTGQLFCKQSKYTERCRRQLRF
jgi:uridine kinase